MDKIYTFMDPFDDFTTISPSLSFSKFFMALKAPSLPPLLQIFSFY